MPSTARDIVSGHRPWETIMGGRAVGQHRKAPEDVEKIFRTFDLDGDGKITAEELKDALAELGEDVTVEDAAERINAGDTDHDGTISLDEFRTLMAG